MLAALTFQGRKCGETRGELRSGVVLRILCSRSISDIFIYSDALKPPEISVLNCTATTRSKPHISVSGPLRGTSHLSLCYR